MKVADEDFARIHRAIFPDRAVPKILRSTPEGYPIANASLIAAERDRLKESNADMLAVLHAIRCTLPGLDGDQGNLFDRVIEAIRKAEGKEGV